MSGVRMCGLTVRFGRRTAVDRFDATVESGQWLCLIGPNGAGKSSILRSVVGLVASEGSVEIGGRSVRGLASPARARLVAYVPQSPVLPDDMTGYESTTPEQGDAD